MNNRQRNGRIPTFFKVFIPDMSTNRMKIPSAFTSYMKGNLPKRASLRDRNGKGWLVKVQKIENDFFFVEGWSKFVEDNSMQLGEFLVFKFDGRSVYDVMLLGHSCCEKNVEKREEDIIKIKEEEEEDEEGKKDDEETDESEKKEEEETDEVEEEEEERNIYNNANERIVDAKYTEVGETTNSHKKLVVGDSKSSQRGGIMFTGEKQGNEKADAVKGLHEGKGPAIDIYGNDIFKSRSIPQPKNPYFVTRVKAKRDEVQVPFDFTKDYNLNLPSEIILRDPNGREWTSKLTSWKDGRLWYHEGWGKLSRINLVDKDDTFICEFVKEEGGGLFIQVHIVYSQDFAANQK